MNRGSSVAAGNMAEIGTEANPKMEWRAAGQRQVQRAMARLSKM